MSWLDMDFDEITEMMDGIVSEMQVKWPRLMEQPIMREVAHYALYSMVERMYHAAADELENMCENYGQTKEAGE